MDFFEHQGQARKRTTLLALAFALAVAVVVIAVDAVVWGVMRFISDSTPDLLAWLATQLAWITTGVVVVIILGTSSWRGVQLAHGGGGRVAIMTGGRFLDPDTVEGNDAVLIHVVEEMAIASGVTVPDVYVLENEQRINAFAAGTQPANAVIVVTRGLLERLDRDALQGVIAHEFSHILNGDMRLNIRLIGLLAGMTVISDIGAAPWRAMFVTSGINRRRSGTHPAFLVAGLALMTIGWLGRLAGRLIKAAVSRQREFLADAAAVQFTRNPDGLASALLEIRQDRGDSRLRATHAEEISHMGFARTVGGINGLTATHPPIEARMQALGPKYELWFRQGERDRRRREREAEAGSSAVASGSTTAIDAPLLDGLGGADTVDAALSTVTLAALAGQADGAALDHARILLRRLPDEILKALHTPNGAADVVAALMLHGTETRERDLQAVPGERREAVQHLRLALESDCPGGDDGALDASIRLPVLELALRSLRRLESPAQQAFLQQIDQQVRTNNRLSPFEYAARTLLYHELCADGARRIGTRRLDRHSEDANVVLSLLAHAGGGGEDQRRTAHARAIRPLFGNQASDILARELCSLKRFTEALERLSGLEPIGKRSLLTACADCIAADGLIRAPEAELVRTIAAVLDAPMPPVAVAPRPSD